MINLIPFDAEYHSSNERNLTLVCISLTWKGEDYDFWLHNKDDWQKAKETFLRIREDKDHALLIFNASAEARVLLSLGLDPRKFNWIDLQIEYKMLTNHWDKFRYGHHIDGKSGKKIFTARPKNKYKLKSVEESQKANGSRPTMSLVCASYKLAKVYRDKENKDEMRDIILSKDFDKIEAHRKEILEYCREDIKHLETMWNTVKNSYREYFKYGVERRPIEDIVTREEVFWRGMTGARAAIIEWNGYPIDVEKAKNFAHNAPIILRDTAEEINSQFDFDLFVVNPKTNSGISKKQKVIQGIIKNSPYASKWPLSAKTKQPSLSLSDAFEKILTYRHNFPKGNALAQFMKYLKIEQALKSFIISKNKKSIFDDLGSDSFVRPYLNPYGSQTGRYQPPSTSFLFLKSAWLRSLCTPPEGYWMVGIDYKSEEALICALESNDEAMIEAYRSGDVYLDFAKRAGAVPKDGTKEKYKKERNLFKSTYLGISYKMGAESLSLKLTEDTGETYTKEQAQALIDKFYKAYPKYAKFSEVYYLNYKYKGYAKLADGYMMFGDNDNYRSICNFPVQGMGSCILRKAIELSQDAGLKVVIPLHDALYILIPKGELSQVDTLQDCMYQAFLNLYPHNKNAGLIQFDIDIWGNGLEEDSIKTPKGRYCTTKRIYIDDRGKEEYEQYSKYFNKLEN